jgi:hypothetical protein
MATLPPPEHLTSLRAAASFLAAYWLLTCVHEAFHVIAACLVGHGGTALTFANLVSGTCEKHVTVKGVAGWRRTMIRHAGWMGSALLAIALCAFSSPSTSVWPAAALLTALDALCSDLLGVAAAATSADTFLCGNFGLVLLKKEHRSKVLQILRGACGKIVHRECSLAQLAVQANDPTYYHQRNPYHVF